MSSPISLLKAYCLSSHTANTEFVGFSTEHSDKTAYFHTSAHMTSALESRVYCYVAGFKKFQKFSVFDCKFVFDYRLLLLIAISVFLWPVCLLPANHISFGTNIKVEDNYHHSESGFHCFQTVQTARLKEQVQALKKQGESCASPVADLMAMIKSRYLKAGGWICQTHKCLGDVEYTVEEDDLVFECHLCHDACEHQGVLAFTAAIFSICYLWDLLFFCKMSHPTSYLSLCPLSLSLTVSSIKWPVCPPL